MIESLKENEVFVFGSNTAGSHGGGAALQAKEQFGAEDGVGEGLTGQCYAFPTLDGELGQLSYNQLRASADLLCETARSLPEKTFLLTKVGCGIAGYPEAFMRQFFANAPKNITQPTWNV